MSQALADKDSRVHCSLNLNTETGRLSARRPNLQVYFTVHTYIHTYMIVGAARSIYVPVAVHTYIHTYIPTYARGS